MMPVAAWIGDVSVSQLARAERPKVLIADDNVDLANTLALMLDSAGYEAAVAASGGVALAALSHEVFNVAVLDLNLPDLSDLELFTALRADIAEVEGIMITGVASTGSAAEAVNRGLFAYLIKPVAWQLLPRSRPPSAGRHPPASGQSCPG